MALVKVVRQGAVTLPAEARRALSIKEGDYLEAEVVDGELRLKPVAVVDRKAAWRRVMAIVEKDKWQGPEPQPSPEEEEQWIYDTVSESRDRDA
ncbi:MAG: AbrB/MazE/SpoVT family DNA-binding domain-containing protein [Geminicoccaceae bacterium]